MTIVKITVLETSLKKDLVDETCCNDGLRPVYFKLEATDDEAGPFLGRD